MILFGHPDVKSISFYRITDVDAITQTPANATLFFNYNTQLAHYCHENSLSFAIYVKEIKELILAHAMGATYLIADKNLAVNAQKIATEYLFDAKILLLSENNDEDIEFAALNGIDGILFTRAICEKLPFIRQYDV